MLVTQVVRILGNDWKHFLTSKGFIRPHVDAVRFCGNTVAGISLLSGKDSVPLLGALKGNDHTLTIPLLPVFPLVIFSLGSRTYV